MRFVIFLISYMEMVVMNLQMGRFIPQISQFIIQCDPAFDTIFLYNLRRCESVSKQTEQQAGFLWLLGKMSTNILLVNY